MPPGFVGFNVENNGEVIEHYVGYCDPYIMDRLSDNIVRLLREWGPTWIEIATNGAHVVYCFAK